jgi:hypothetical protein
MDDRYPPVTHNPNYIPPHHLGYPPTEHYPPAQSYYHNHHQYSNQTPYQRQNNYQANWRSRGQNNWRQPCNNTSNIMEIGKFFVRAEQALNAIQRRSRG